jgi:hypothetical protein
VDDRASDVGCVGCAAQMNNSPQHDRAKYVCTLECYRVGDVGRVSETNYRVRASYSFGRHNQDRRHDHPRHAPMQKFIVLGRVIGFGGTADIINTIALQCTNALGTIVLIWVAQPTSPARSPTSHFNAKNSSDAIVLGRVISFRRHSLHHQHDSTRMYKRTWHDRVGASYSFGRHNQHRRHDHPRHTDVGCAAQINNSPQHDRAKCVCTFWGAIVLVMVVSPKPITRPNTICVRSIFALEYDVDDRAGDVGCTAQMNNSPQHDRAKYVCTLECRRVD